MIKRSLFGGVAGACFGVVLSLPKEIVLPSPWHEFGSAGVVMVAAVGAVFGTLGSARLGPELSAVLAAGVMAIEGGLAEGVSGSEVVVRIVVTAFSAFAGAATGLRLAGERERPRHSVAMVLHLVVALTLAWGLAWSLVPHGVEQRTGHAVEALTYSPDGRTLAIGTTAKVSRISPVPDYDGVYHRVLLWDVSTRLLEASSPARGRQGELVFSPDGSMLASVEDEWVVLRKIPRFEPTQRLPTGDVWTLAFSPDGRTLAVGTRNTAQLWDVGSGQLRSTLGHPSRVTGVAFLSDGRRLATGSHDGELRIWDTARGTIDASVGTHPRGVSRLAVSPDGQRLASGGWDKQVLVWSVDGNREPLELAGHTDIVTSVAFSPDGNTVAAGGDDESVRLWDATTGRLRVAWPGPSGAIAFTPDGRRLAVGKAPSTFLGNADGEVSIWDLGSRVRDDVVRVPARLHARPWFLFAGALVFLAARVRGGKASSSRR